MTNKLSSKNGPFKRLEKESEGLEEILIVLVAIGKQKLRQY